MELENKVRIETKGQIIESEDAQIDVSSTGYCYEFKIVAYKAKVTNKEYSVPTPELYLDDLVTIRQVMAKLDDIALVEGVFQTEIRVKTYDGSTWVVIGYGESGDPAILRFENG